MRLDLYQAECERIAKDQISLLSEVKQRLALSESLSRLEQNGVLHTLQILIENAIGKCKHLLKSLDESIPVSAYDAFASLERRGIITQQQLTHWNAIIGMRNRIVHDYMNVDINIIYLLITNNGHQMIGEFLCKPITTNCN